MVTNLFGTAPRYPKMLSALANHTGQPKLHEFIRRFHRENVHKLSDFLTFLSPKAKKWQKLGSSHDEK